MTNLVNRCIAGGAVLCPVGLIFTVPLKWAVGFSWWWIALQTATGCVLYYLTCCIAGSSRVEPETRELIIPGTEDERARRVVFLFVCSANVARSATAEHLARRGRCISDSVGSHPSVAVRRLTVESIRRARLIVCMEQEHADAVMRLAPERAKDIIVWGIPDDYHYCEPALIAAIGRRLDPLMDQWHHRRFLFLGSQELEEQ